MKIDNLLNMRIACVLMMTLMIVPPAGGTEVENVVFDKQVVVGQQALEIKGAGVLRYLRFIKAYAGALYTQPGDRCTLTYLPGVGTELALNSRPMGVIEGADFAAAIFSLWLGKNPYDKQLNPPRGKPRGMFCLKRQCCAAP